MPKPPAAENPVSLAKVLSELEAAQKAGVLDRYAVGGAVGATFYIEPAATETVDIFIAMIPKPGSILVTLDPLYSFFESRGATVEDERLVIGGWLVQLLPSPTDLVAEALDQARPTEVEGVTVPVFKRNIWPRLRWKRTDRRTSCGCSSSFSPRASTWTRSTHSSNDSGSNSVGCG